MERPTFELSSGFTIRVKTLGPFALDPIRAKWRDPGSFTYKVTTKGEGVVDFLYDPPDSDNLPKPPPEGDQDIWELYLAYLAHENKRQTIAEGFERDSTAFILLNCFEIVSGPIACEDDEWLSRLSLFVEETTKTERLLLFLKTQVLAIPFQEWAAIRQICVAPEVSLEGIFDALAMFRADMGWGGPPTDMGATAIGETEPQHEGMGDSSSGDTVP